MSTKLSERLNDWATYRGDLVDDVRALEAQLEQALLDRDHWRSNHAAEVEKNALLRQRPDLPIDRIPAYEKLCAERDRYKELYEASVAQRIELADERDTLQTKIDRMRDTIANLPAPKVRLF